ncbi:MAG: hypothetical protein K2Y51_21430 [Gammaproteobacteria bacterium]|jgi:hypothetical protein|nr:hypothetical protein [Gammaproteobacteria bacterium]
MFLTLIPGRRAGLLGRALAPLALLLALVGCEPEVPPQTVAEHFWRAVITADRAAMAREVRAADQDDVQNDAALLPVERFTLGKIVIDGARASIDTELTLGGETPMNLAVVTVLAKESDRWRVDYPTTVSRLRNDGGLAHLLGRLRGLGRELGDGLDRSMGDLQRAIPELESELERLEKDLRGKLPALRRQLEDLTRGLERAPEPRQPSPDAPPDTVKAI